MLTRPKDKNDDLHTSSGVASWRWDPASLGSRSGGSVPVTCDGAALAMDDDETGPKQIRITSGGKIKSFVSLALDFFEVSVSASPRIALSSSTIMQKYDSRPLVFHTLPHDPPGQTTSDLHNVTLIIPRLISVVEIIKREFLKLLHEKHSKRLVGLHQYNQLGTLEDLGYGEDEGTPESRDKQIAHALEGKNQWALLFRRTALGTDFPQH